MLTLAVTTTMLVGLVGYGFSLGIIYGLVALIASFPLVLWYLYRHRP